MPDANQNLEEYHEYLGLLGRLQLNDKLAGKVDVSGVVQITLLEAHRQGCSELSEDERVPWLRRVFADRVVRIHDTAKGDDINALRGHAYPLEAVALLPDGKRLVSVGGYRRYRTRKSRGPRGYDTQGEAIVWHLDTRQGRRVIRGGTHLFTSEWRLVVSGKLGTATPPGNLTIHDLPSGERRDFSPPHGYAATAALARDGKLLAASTHNGGANIWDVERGKLLVRIPDGPPVGHDKQTRLLSADSGEERFVSTGGGLAFTSDGHSTASREEYTSDGRRFVTWEPEHGFLVRDAEDGGILIRGGEEDLHFDKIKFAPNDRFVATASEQGAVVWDLVDRKILWSIEGEVTSNIAFDAASRRVACGTFDGSLVAGDLETGETVVSRGHTDYVTTVAITRDGLRVASTSQDDTVRIWDTRSGRELLTFFDPNPDSRYSIRSLKFGPRDHLLATTGPPLALWDGRPVE